MRNLRTILLNSVQNIWAPSLYLLKTIENQQLYSKNITILNAKIIFHGFFSLSIVKISKFNWNIILYLWWRTTMFFIWFMAGYNICLKSYIFAITINNSSLIKELLVRTKMFWISNICSSPTCIENKNLRTHRISVT